MRRCVPPILLRTMMVRSSVKPPRRDKPILAKRTRLENYLLFDDGACCSFRSNECECGHFTADQDRFAGDQDSLTRVIVGALFELALALAFVITVSFGVTWLVPSSVDSDTPVKGHNISLPI